jgi:uncharacterized membrane protein (UPF0136 family)
MNGAMSSNLVLWIYIVLLVVGGIIGFVKAKSAVSLIMSVVFAAALSLVAAGILTVPHLADILLVALLVVFGIRLAKTRKFMPGGLMVVLTAVTLALLHL